MFCSLSIFLALEVALHTSVSVQLNLGSFRRMIFLYIAAAIPFVLSGLLFSVVFARNAANVSRLYGADLAGGALACLLTVPLLNSIGGPNCILFSAAAMAVAAAIWGDKRAWRFAGIILSVAFLALIAANTTVR